MRGWSIMVCAASLALSVEAMAACFQSAEPPKCARDEYEANILCRAPIEEPTIFRTDLKILAMFSSASMPDLYGEFGILFLDYHISYEAREGAQFKYAMLPGGESVYVYKSESKVIRCSARNDRCLFRDTFKLWLPKEGSYSETLTPNALTLDKFIDAVRNSGTNKMKIIGSGGSAEIELCASTFNLMAVALKMPPRSKRP